MNYYERHIGDYLKDTAHLSLLEHGIYTRLLDVYYTREEPIPAKDAARLIGARSREEKEALFAVLDEFFKGDGEHWLQPRCEAEIARYRDKQRKAKASADARWGKSERNANASPDDDANGMRSHSEGNAPRARPQTPDTSNQTPDLTHSSNAPGNTPTSDEVGRARRPDDPQLPGIDPPPHQPEGPPDCPHLEVLALWGRALPAMPQHAPSQWKGTRADNLRARWRETAIEKAWPSQASGLAYLAKLFAYVGQSQFLTGRSATRDGKRPFVVELEWLVKPGNWAKVIEGKYHSEAA